MGRYVGLRVRGIVDRDIHSLILTPHNRYSVVKKLGKFKGGHEILNCN